MHTFVYESVKKTRKQLRTAAEIKEMNLNLSLDFSG